VPPKNAITVANCSPFGAGQPKLLIRDPGIDTRSLQTFMGHRSISNTVIYTAVADKRIRNIWGKR
jgi:hypothetical protein